MEKARTPECSEDRQIVWLADYRRRIVPGDDEHPPPAPRPCAARRPAPLTSTNVLACLNRRDGPARAVHGALVPRSTELRSDETRAA